jgi:hypothetical protein
VARSYQPADGKPQTGTAVAPVSRFFSPVERFSDLREDFWSHAFSVVPGTDRFPSGFLGSVYNNMSTLIAATPKSWFIKITSSVIFDIPAFLKYDSTFLIFCLVY